MHINKQSQSEALTLLNKAWLNSIASFILGPLSHPLSKYTKLSRREKGDISYYGQRVKLRALQRCYTAARNLQYDVMKYPLAALGNPNYKRHVELAQAVTEVCLLCGIVDTDLPKELNNNAPPEIAYAHLRDEYVACVQLSVAGIALGKLWDGYAEVLRCVDRGEDVDMHHPSLAYAQYYVSLEHEKVQATLSEAIYQHAANLPENKAAILHYNAADGEIGYSIGLANTPLTFTTPKKYLRSWKDLGKGQVLWRFGITVIPVNASPQYRIIFHKDTPTSSLLVNMALVSAGLPLKLVLTGYAGRDSFHAYFIESVTAD